MAETKDAWLVVLKASSKVYLTADLTGNVKAVRRVAQMASKTAVVMASWLVV